MPTFTLISDEREASILQHLTLKQFLCPDVVNKMNQNIQIIGYKTIQSHKQAFILGTLYAHCNNLYIQLYVFIYVSNVKSLY